MEYQRSIVPRIISVILFLAVIFGVIFYVLPLNNSYQSLLDENVAAKQKKQTMQDELTTLENVKKSLGKITESEEGIQRVLKVIPTNVDQSQIIDNFQSIAEINKITYNSLGFSVQKNVSPGIHAVVVNASFEGDYEDLKNFLKSLEASTRKLVIKNINVQVGDEVEVQLEDAKGKPTEKVKKRNAIFTLSVEVYYQNI